MQKIESLTQVADVLLDQGYEAELNPDAVFVKIGGSEAPFTAVVTTGDDGKSLSITCQLAKLGDFPEGNTPNFMLAALDANTAIRPYAFAIISDSDDENLDEPEDWPVVLTDSLTLGDLCAEELMASVDNLWSALAASRPVLEIGLGA